MSTNGYAPRILVAAGGTGGHVYPALAIADAIRAAEPAVVIEFAGTRDRLEWEAVPRAGYAIHPIAAAGLSRTHLVRNAGLPITLVRGVTQAIRLVGDFDADVVVGTGGYVTGPVGLAAAVRRRPLLVQEQNAHAGVTNRLLGRWAARVHVAFEEARRPFPPDRTVVTGNPVRAEIGQADRADARSFHTIPEGNRVLLILGGSLGSQAMNDAVADRIEEIDGSGTTIIWQTGPRYFERMAARVGDRGAVRLHRYIDRMDLAYGAADLVLCRAGAITCSELLAAGRASVLVPSPNVAEDHQTRNAESLVRMGAAVLLPEPQMAGKWVECVRDLFDDGPRRASMVDAARTHAAVGAADRIARDVLKLAAGRSR